MRTRLWQSLTLSVLGHLVLLCVLVTAGTKHPGPDFKCITVTLLPGGASFCPSDSAGAQGIGRGPGTGAEVELREPDPERHENTPKEEPVETKPVRREDVKAIRQTKAKENQHRPSFKPKPAPAHSPAATIEPAHSGEAAVVPDHSGEPGPGNNSPAAGGTGAGGLAGGTGGKGGASSGVLNTELGSANGPHFIRRAKPNYPSVARQLGKEGLVLLRITLDEHGKVTSVEVVNKAGSGFDEEAVRAAGESIFSPAQKDGRPVGCKVLLPVRFLLKGSG